MITNYGYSDGSGTFLITIDTDKCDSCRKCVEVCPSGILEMAPNEFDPLDEELIVMVKEAHRNKIKYSCAPCKPVTGRQELPCIKACQSVAITHSW